MNVCILIQDMNSVITMFPKIAHRILGNIKSVTIRVCSTRLIHNISDILK